MKIIYAVLFFIVTSAWVGLIFVFLELLDMGASTRKFILILLAIMINMGLFFFLLSKYLDLPSSRQQDGRRI
jgi:hypothetical protein